MSNSYMQSLDTNPRVQNYFVVEENGTISFNTTNPLAVDISYTGTGNRTASFKFGNEYLDRNSNNDDAGKTQTQTWFTLVDAGQDGTDQVYLIQTSWITPTGKVTRYLTIPDAGTPGTDPLVFSPLPAGTTPPTAPRKQKWVFKPIPPPDDLIRK